MTASITFMFGTRDELHATLRAFLGQAAVVASTATTTADEAPRAKRERQAKAEPVEAPKAEPAPEKTKAVALGDVVGAIRSFVLADKVGNMKRLIPLMPEGKKSLDSLDLEEAQRIALQLGIEVG
jgi:hypothetical protein